MTARVVVRPAARRHIHEIADYIAADSLGASDRFIDEVYTAFDLLARMPLVGSARRFRRQSLKGLRLWQCRNFQTTLSFTAPRAAELK